MNILLQLAKNKSPRLEIQKQRSTFPPLQSPMLSCIRPRLRLLHEVETVGEDTRGR